MRPVHVCASACGASIPPGSNVMHISIHTPIHNARVGGLCLLLMLVLAVLSGACFVSATQAEAAHPPRYEQAKKGLEQLGQDARRSAWREPWQILAEEFLAIYEREKKWSSRPAALFRSAVALDELARRSWVRKDAELAVQRYLRLADAHTTSPLADDALLAASRLQAERLNDVDGASATVARLCASYPKSAECRQGRDLIKNYTSTAPTQAAPAPPQQTEKAPPATESAPPPPAGPARITSVTWDTKGKGVRIEVTLDKSAPWELRSQAANSKSGGTPSLTLDLFDTRPDPSVPPGSKIAGSALQRVRLDYHKSQLTRMLLDFSKLEAFSVQAEDGDKKLIIHAAGSATVMPRGLRPGQVVRSQSLAAAERRKASAEESRAFWVATRNMASQFGLSVRTVVIDPGHGGKDPGTHHNGILEREVALDLAVRLGKVLKAQGFDVKYTRTRDTWITLNERTAIANRMKGDLFVSLHINASNNPKKSGFETYYLDVSSSAAAASLASFENLLSNRKLGDLEHIVTDLMRGARKDESMRLARDIQQHALALLRKKGFAMENGGSRGAPFVVLMGTTMPAVLVEAGYCTNQQEAKRLSSMAFRNAMVQGIADGIVTYAERLRSAPGK